MTTIAKSMREKFGIFCKVLTKTQSNVMLFDGIIGYLNVSRKHWRNPQKVFFKEAYRIIQNTDEAEYKTYKIKYIENTKTGENKYSTNRIIEKS